MDRAFGDEEMLPRLAQPHVTHLGLIGMEAKRELLRDARALLMPIEWNEPFGLAVIEAMLSGCPPVAFPRGSMPELIEPGVTGFLVSSGEEMAELIRPGGPLDGFDRRRCPERAVERFSRDHVGGSRVALEFRRHSSRTLVNLLAIEGDPLQVRTALS